MLNMKEQFVWDVIDNNGGLEAVDASVTALIDYMETEYSYESKNNRLDAMATSTTLTTLYELVVSVFTAALIHKKLTYQTICGMLYHKVDLPVVLDRIKTIAEIIAVVSKSGLIHINRQGAGKPIMITPGFNIGVELPAPDKHQLTIGEPSEVKNNWFDGSMLLGNPMNHHNKELCLDHINRMNAIEISLNETFIQEYPETTTNSINTQQKADQWNQFVDDSYDKYTDFIAAGNRGYMNHKYCTRGRSYALGYYITTQGAAYKKAMVDLANKEIVEGL